MLVCEWSLQHEASKSFTQLRAMVAASLLTQLDKSLRSNRYLRLLDVHNVSVEGSIHDFLSTYVPVNTQECDNIIVLMDALCSKQLFDNDKYQKRQMTK